MNYYNEIKENLINNEVYKAVKDYSKNKSDLETYYKVGKLLSEAGKHYGEGIIKEYSIKLTKELGIKYNERTLRRFRQFYELFNNIKWSTLSTNLTWSQYVEILSLKDINIIKYYINMCNYQNLSVRELRTKIKSHEYEGLSEETKTKLINQEKTNIKDLVPSPIIIKNNKFVMEYCSDPRIIAREYIINN